MKKIIYQGDVGSYSHTTGLWFFGKKNKFIGVHHFKDIFDSLKSGEADYGVVPIENTLAGSVYENYEHLLKSDVQIIAEHKLRIRHNLLALPQASFKDIKKVYSHHKALEQCDRFFESNSAVEEVVYYDTAGAAKMVGETKDKSLAAIASVEAAEIYGLKILKKNTEDNKNNWTRFFIIRKNGKKTIPQGANKASLIFSTSHKPGSLFNALKSFADHRLNLTKLESRPLPNKPFEYYFYVDFEFDPKHQELVEETFQDLKKNTHILKILGYYKKDNNGRA